MNRDAFTLFVCRVLCAICIGAWLLAANRFAEVLQ
jgi:hypothetical protein